MRIIPFAEVIKQLPEDQHSFLIKKIYWTNTKEVVKLFDEKDSMNISRSCKVVKSLILKLSNLIFYKIRDYSDNQINFLNLI